MSEDLLRQEFMYFVDFINRGSYVAIEFLDEGDDVLVVNLSHDANEHAYGSGMQLRLIGNGYNTRLENLREDRSNLSEIKRQLASRVGIGVDVARSKDRIWMLIFQNIEQEVYNILIRSAKHYLN